ncbi:ABC transporter permease [Ilyobacter polytropus]|uniref:Binding-protein-dependent transport systems inner membrane component n=1 Tax=Ilyobacter polytropus (strain ATCC 51220 / DSM 2926 / LMG 16218 / CuHBu1) TaxID=572544 RepID=E3H6Z5_ILYPC|nr:ABC transporter permease [Ilyobacter polytropus]ADO82514.1 binding-protein-dependent transport systems inner membrane component [Ilyobacter polytropus DSM 2926]
MKKKWLYALLLPGLILIVLFLLVPLVYTTSSTVIDGSKLTLERYLVFFKDEYYLKIYNRTLKIALITAVISMILGTPVAYFISRSKKSLRGIFIACTVFPLLTNSVVRSFAWMTILGKNGVFNNIFMALHLVDKPVKLLYTEFAIIIGSVYLFLPLMVVSLVGVMENIEDDLLEAAESLGANKFTAFFKVIFPLSMPGLIVGSVLVFTGAFTAYTTPQLLGGNQNMVLATLVYQRAMTLGDWTGASVVATVMIITTLTVIGIINKLAGKLNERGV